MAPAFASSIELLLASDTPPAGVVFEIVEGDGDALEVLLPRLRLAIEKLRGRFPDIELAVVSHGSEQFALQTRYRDEYADIHGNAQSLLGDGVPLHVCGAHAGWYGVNPEDFPDYVDVAASGPAQINDYRALGYELVRIETGD